MTCKYLKLSIISDQNEVALPSMPREAECKDNEWSKQQQSFRQHLPYPPVSIPGGLAQDGANLIVNIACAEEERCLEVVDRPVDPKDVLSPTKTCLLPSICCDWQNVKLPRVERWQTNKIVVLYSRCQT